MFDEIFQQGVEEEEEEEEEEDKTDNTYIRPPSPPGKEVAGPGLKQSLVMQTLLTNYRPVQQGWLAKKVVNVTMSQCHNVIMSQCHNVIMS